MNHISTWNQVHGGLNPPPSSVITLCEPSLMDGWSPISHYSMKSVIMCFLVYNFTIQYLLMGAELNWEIPLEYIIDLTKVSYYSNGLIYEFCHFGRSRKYGYFQTWYRPSSLKRLAIKSTWGSWQIPTIFHTRTVNC